MPLTIHANLNAMAAQRHAGRSHTELATAIARLSSGLRINVARDDAAGLAIADRLQAQVRGTSQAGRNANDAISLAQTAEAALGHVAQNVQRIRELAVQAANPTNTSVDRAALQLEVAQLVDEVDRIATHTQFNGVKLLDGSFTAQSFQVGADRGQSITVPPIDSVRTDAIGIVRGFARTNMSNGSSPETLWPRWVQVGSDPPIYTGVYNHTSRDLVRSVAAAEVPGLYGVANPTVANGVASASSASTAGTAVYTINGVAISMAGLTGAGNLAANRASAVAAINAQTGATHVSAVDTGSSVRLISAEGYGITTSYAAGSFTGSTSADFGVAAAASTGGTWNLYYTQPADVFGDITLIRDSPPQEFVYTVAPMGSGLASLSVASAAEAQTAMVSCDVALRSVGASRATLGAVQNRLQTAIETLGRSGENLAAARSRIQDADFAMETANLSRTQVLLEAGTAMVAQANQLPQQVLALLR